MTSWSFLPQALLAPRGVIISSQFCSFNAQRVCTIDEPKVTDAGCPKTGTSAPKLALKEDFRKFNFVDNHFSDLWASLMISKSEKWEPEMRRKVRGKRNSCNETFCLLQRNFPNVVTQHLNSCIAF